MQIVIDIDDEIIIDAKDFPNLCLYCHSDKIWKAISKGVRLPKKHGRLIDTDVLTDGMIDNYEFCEIVNTTPTIIPAHYEEDNDNDKV